MANQHAWHFILLFENIETNEQYRFIYEAIESEGKQPFLTFRMTEELTLPSIEELIAEFFETAEAAALDYGPTFYKVANSQYMKWYDAQHPSRKDIRPDAQHHLFVTSTLYIEIITEIEPSVYQL
ncbi:hypothetical protein A6K76_16340 [Caryophanon latum]|uniref:Uncharacterized protein n=2 Tax=Caryophanon latum TaxID=33977 RepID=A0A1C0Y534_9BACL|nr:hypothetical protein A6K76_16340 [Caryophanon latum]